MDIIVSLVLMASLMHGNSGVPVQIPSANQQNQVNSTESTQEVFSMILEANKGSTMILKEGDILMPTDRNALICHYGRDSCRWNKNSNGIVNVPYTMSSDYSDIQESLITTAMQDFATLTCVRFIPRTTETDFLQIQSRSGCYSNVGKTGRSQVVSLQSPGCLQKGVIQHELNHALGFYHEQSRSDRDNYVKIIKDNVTPGAETNFNKEETNNLGLEYDYSSVMHYGMYAFSKASGLPTIVPKPDDSVRIGQRYGLSNLDVSKINKLYDCGVCSSVLSSLTGTVMSANYPSNYPANAKCVWLIQAPGYMVFFQFNAFDIPASPDCASGYLTIYDGATRSSPVLLNRACGSIQLSSYMASSNTVLLELVSSSARTGTGFKVSYSTVQYGAILTDPSGSISPPDSFYTSEFVWVIKAPAGNKISLTINRIGMYSATCSKVYLTVIDGPFTTSPQIGTYCSPNKVPSILSSGNTLLVQFHRDGTMVNATFLAGYSFVTQN